MAALQWLVFIDELRQRVWRCLFFYIGLCCLLIWQQQAVITWFIQPLLAHTQVAHLLATQMTAPVFMPLLLAAKLALLALVPVLCYQVFAYIAPSLYPRERKRFQACIIPSVGLFYAGCALSYFLVLPLVCHVFAAAVPAGVDWLPDISHYTQFVLQLMLAFGFAFQLPIVIVLAVQLGWLSVAQLRQWRAYVIVTAFVLGMLLTPPDVISQILLALPLWGLYELTLLGLSYAVAKS